MDGRFVNTKTKFDNKTTVDLYFEEKTVVQLKDPEGNIEPPKTRNQTDVEGKKSSSSSSNG